MSPDRSQVPYMPNSQPQLAQVAERLEYRRLLMMALALVAAALAGWLYLSQASTVAAYTHTISSLEERKTLLRQDIQHLKASAAGATSLQHLQQSAERLGFRQPAAGEAPNRQVIVVAEAPVAAPEPVEASAAPVAQRNVFRRLWGKFQAWLRAEPGT